MVICEGKPTLTVTVTGEDADMLGTYKATHKRANMIATLKRFLGKANKQAKTMTIKVNEVIGERVFADEWVTV